MIANRNPLIIRHQRLIGAKQFADIGRMMDRGVKIRVVANLRRYAVFGLALRDQARTPNGLRLRAGVTA